MPSCIVVAFGIAARIALTAIRKLRQNGHKIGLLRPVTLFPFPEAPIQALAGGMRRFVTVELNSGQMVEDVRLAVNGKSEVLFYGRPGGAIITPEELYEKLLDDVAQFFQQFGLYSCQVALRNTARGVFVSAAAIGGSDFLYIYFIYRPETDFASVVIHFPDKYRNFNIFHSQGKGGKIFSVIRGRERCPQTSFLLHG